MKRVKSVLIIDDDNILCGMIKANLHKSNFRLLIANTCKDGLTTCEKEHIDIVILDQCLPDGEGHLLTPNILKHNEQTKIIFISAFPSFENAVKALKVGAHDYLSKPFEIGALELAIEKAIRTQELEQIEQIQTYQRTKDEQTKFITGEHPSIKKIKQLVQLAARSNAPVLLTGETGTGKSLTAKAIHYSSRQAKAPFIPINCASLPDNLFEAELFGYEKGAFTDAKTSRKGIFVMAEGGTLLLDEIGTVPMHLQSKLLAVLDDKRIKKLGGDHFIPVNVRIISATNIDLEKAILEKRFREDLYYRLDVIHIHMPPLRDRLSDIPSICRQLMPKISIGANAVIPDSEMTKLLDYEWPGNIRELRNVLERALILQEGQKIRPSLLLRSNQKTKVNLRAYKSGTASTLITAEKEHILNVLKSKSNNITHTAETLGISLSTLKRKMKKHQISIHEQD